MFHAFIGEQNCLCRIIGPVTFYDFTPEHFIVQDAPHIVVTDLHFREVPLQRSADGLNHPAIQEQLTDYVFVEYAVL